VQTIKKVLENPNLLTDHDKRAVFAEELKEEAKRRGTSLKDHAINAIRELTISYLKEKGII